MALLDTLRGRAARKGGTAQVPCGALGTLTVEALSLAECARLGGNPRSLFYAACRELQSAGEALRKEGLVFRPDEIMESVTEEEARLAAQAILALSGVSAPAAEEAAAEAPWEASVPSAEAESGAFRQTEARAAEAAANLPSSASYAVPEEPAGGALPSLSAAPDSGTGPRLNPSPQVAPEGVRSVLTEAAPVFEAAEEFPAPAAPSHRLPAFRALSSEERQALAAEAAQILAQELRRAAAVR